jgi:hypothetical protein
LVIIPFLNPGDSSVKKLCNMKKVLLLLFSVVFIVAVQAQTAANYSFSKSQNVSLENISSGTTTIFSGATAHYDDNVALFTLPFAFSYAGTSYTQFSVSTNGLIGFGPIAVTNAFANNPLNQNIVAAFWDDLYMPTGNSIIRYKTVGTAGSRKLVIEWSNISHISEVSVPLSFQAWLFEGSNAIEFVYDGGGGSFLTASVGLISQCAIPIYQSVNTSNHTVSSNSFSILNGWPGTGRSYSFTPSGGGGVGCPLSGGTGTVVPCGNGDDKILVCHNGNEVCVSLTAAVPLLQQGATLGQCPVTAKQMIPGELPTRFALSNYPNPASYKTTIQYSLPVQSKVSIKIYDVTGKEISSLLNANKAAGIYTVDLNASQLSSGIYYCKMVTASTTGESVQTIKMTIAK